MPRPCKRRRICALPENRSFAPIDGASCSRAVVIMTVDEFESIRLIDLLALTQEACAQRMGVSRTTAQAIYNSARKKLASCLIQGSELRIEGGDFVLCSGEGCGHKSCHKRNCYGET